MKNIIRFDTEEYLRSTTHRTNQYVHWINTSVKNSKREESPVVQQAYVYSRAFLITVSRINSILHASKKPLGKEKKLILLEDVGHIYDTSVTQVLGKNVHISSEKLTGKVFSAHGSKVTMDHLHDLAFRKLHLVPDKIDPNHELAAVSLSAWIVSGILPEYLKFIDIVHENHS